MRRLSKSAVALAVVSVLIASGGAYALVSGGGRISACVHRATGVLYVHRPCARRDRRLTWNVSGPRGLTGPRGATGPQGVAGASATKLFAQINADGTVNSSSGGVQAAKTNGAGSYLVNFGQDVTHCGATATQAGLPVYRKPGTAGTPATGSPVLAIDSDPASGSPVNFPNGFPIADTIQVSTYSGTTRSDSSFMLAVFC